MTTLQHLPDRFRCSHLYVIIYHLCFSHGASCCAGWEIWGEPVPPSVAQSVESVSRLVVGIWDNMFTYTSEKFHLNLTGSWHDRLVSTLSLKVPMWYKEALPIGYDNRLLARRWNLVLNGNSSPANGGFGSIHVKSPLLIHGWMAAWMWGYPASYQAEWVPCSSVACANSTSCLAWILKYHITLIHVF